MASGCGAPLDVEALRERAAAAAPSWNNYSEDLKAQLGATAVALWTGWPKEAQRDGQQLKVRFGLEGPWREFSFGMPVLLMEPGGRVYNNQACSVSAGEAVYTFELKGEGAAMDVPWVVVRYPTGEKRLGLTTSPSESVDG